MSGHTDNSVFIEAPLDLVWDMTNDVESWPDLFTEYAAAKIIHRDGDTVRFRLSMHPDDRGVVWSWVSERTADRKALRVSARRVEPGPFEYMNIEWTYAEELSGIRMRWVQDFRMRPDAPVDTAVMTERINTNTPIQMKVIKEKVERRLRPARIAPDDALRPGGKNAADDHRCDLNGPGCTAPALPAVEFQLTSSPDSAGRIRVADVSRLTSSPSPTTSEGPAVLIKTIGMDDVPENRRRGGDIRALLSPATVGATSGFLGTLTLKPGEVVTEHWHPYSEEFLFCVSGQITIRLDGESRTLSARHGLLIPIGVRHRLENDGSKTAFFVFQLGPLAPRPELGHVDTEPMRQVVG